MHDRSSCASRACKFERDEDFAVSAGSVVASDDCVAVTVINPLLLRTRLPSVDKDWATAMGLSGDRVSVRASIFSGGTPFVSTPITTIAYLNNALNITHYRGGGY